MNKKTKIVILIIALIIVITAVVIAVVKPFDNKTTEAEPLNNTQINTEINNEEANTENVITEENNTETTNNEKEPEQQTSSSDNAKNSNEEKAIELVKKEWGEDSSVYFDLAGVTSDGKYRVSVNKDTKVLAWYIVDVESETVTQK